jgi:hypothetical protein
LPRKYYKFRNMVGSGMVWIRYSWCLWDFSFFCLEFSRLCLPLWVDFILTLASQMEENWCSIFRLHVHTLCCPQEEWVFMSLQSKERYCNSLGFDHLGSHTHLWTNLCGFENKDMDCFLETRSQSPSLE